MNGEQPQRKRKIKKPSPATEPMTSITSLPYDLLLNCLARVSRLYHPTLCLVSRNFQSIVTSLELYETRSRLNCTERCLYLCFQFPSDHKTYWFTLHKPNRNSGNLLVQVPSPNALLPVQWSTLVAVGSNIYKIGGADSYRYKFGKRPSSSFVSYLDCRSHKWHQAPNMQVKRRSSSTASSVDGKIYVAGGCEDPNSLNWIEVFDPKTKTWGSVTNPRVEIQYEGYVPSRVVKSLGIEGKLYMFGDESQVYNPKEDKWNAMRVDNHLRRAVDSRSSANSSSCVTDNVLFIWDDGVFKWYDFKVSLWKELKGVEGLPDFRHRKFCKMVDLGGKIAVLWDDEGAYTSIWCAEIGLERRDGDEIWGKVECFDLVLSPFVLCLFICGSSFCCCLMI